MTFPSSVVDETHVAPVLTVDVIQYGPLCHMDTIMADEEANIHTEEDDIEGHMRKTQEREAEAAERAEAKRRYDSRVILNAMMRMKACSIEDALNKLDTIVKNKHLEEKEKSKEENDQTQETEQSGTQKTDDSKEEEKPTEDENAIRKHEELAPEPLSLPVENRESTQQLATSPSLVTSTTRGQIQSNCAIQSTGNQSTTLAPEQISRRLQMSYEIKLSSADPDLCGEVDFEAELPRIIAEMEKEYGIDWVRELGERLYEIMEDIEEERTRLMQRLAELEEQEAEEKRRLEQAKESKESDEAKESSPVACGTAPEDIPPSSVSRASSQGYMDESASTLASSISSDSPTPSELLSNSFYHHHTQADQRALQLQRLLSASTDTIVDLKEKSIRRSQLRLLLNEEVPDRSSSTVSSKLAESDSNRVSSEASTPNPAGKQSGEGNADETVEGAVVGSEPTQYDELAEGQGMIPLPSEYAPPIINSFTGELMGDFGRSGQEDYDDDDSVDLIPQDDVSEEEQKQIEDATLMM